MKRRMTDTEMRSCLLSMMSYVDNWCRRNNVDYYLYFGTLIGAVRHKGFIPWDDDLDIAMPRKSYNKFVNEFNMNTDNRYEVININNRKGYFLPFSKVIDKKTILIERIHHSIETGVYIDVFPIDSFGHDMNIAKSYNKKLWFYIDILSSKLITIHKNRPWWRNIISVLASCYPISIKQLVVKIDRMACKFNKDNNYSLCGVAVAKSYKKGPMPSSWFQGSIKVDFEGLKLNVPVYYDNILTHLYGNYMKLPAEEKRVPSHNYDVYWISDNNTFE